MTDSNGNGAKMAGASQYAVPCDPRGESFTDSPYVVVPQLTPDTPFKVCNVLQQKLQKQNGPEGRAAFRTVRNLVSRVVWDLHTFGTTPGIPEEEWNRITRLLGNDRREEAFQSIAGSVSDLVEGTAALHVSAVLTANDVAAERRSNGITQEKTLERFVGLWAALLDRTDWLLQFALHRCQVWQRAAPDRGDQAQILDGVSNAIESMLQTAVGPEQQQQSHWSLLWTRERAAIEVCEIAWRSRAGSEWTSGFGPLGLKLLKEEKHAREWVLSHSRPYRGGLPLAAVRAGDALLTRPGMHVVAETATAMQLLFSGLGAAAAHVWNGQGRAAFEILRELTRDDAMVDDAWFGHGAGGQLRRQRAADELGTEALLLRLREELSRHEVAVGDLVETVRRLLFMADTVRCPYTVIEKIESWLVGRLSACASESRLPSSLEVERIVCVSVEVGELLKSRGAGQSCNQPLAMLLKRRAVKRWNRTRNLPPLLVQHQIMKDMFQAAQLAPNNSDVIINLGRLVVQMDHDSSAERTDRYRRVMDFVSAYTDIAGSNKDIEELRLELLEVTDPEAARDEVARRLRAARDSDRNRTDNGSDFGSRMN